ncbi:hypothetical protein MKEN_00293100 [Mycena kentingensis (nom. inval.)]|nr:hypothetical protein MKEN_00293100 [Mycena kentingensis (nom. inval.)]
MLFRLVGHGATAALVDGGRPRFRSSQEVCDYSAAQKYTSTRFARALAPNSPCSALDMLLILTLAFMFSHRFSSSGAPTAPTFAPSANVTVGALTASEICADLYGCRTLGNLVSGCLATIFACVWVSVHPNVPPSTPGPPSGPTPWERFAHRCSGASSDESWQLVHRDGKTTEEPGSQEHPSSVWIWFRWWFYDSRVALRSRLKLMAIALLAPEIIVTFASRQFFVARFFARAYGISLTHGFFLCMGGFVDNTGHPIVRSAQLSPEMVQAIQSIPRGRIQDKSKNDAFTKTVTFLQTAWFILQCIARSRRNLPLSALEVATLAFAVLNLITRILWLSKPLGRPYLTVRLAAALRDIAPFLGFAYPYEALRPDSVPMLWSAASEDWDAHDKAGNGILSFMSLFLGAAFGVTHCIAWNSQFPSYVEAQLWRAGSLVMVVASIASLLLLLLISALQDSSRHSAVSAVFFAGLMPLLVAYIIARLALLIIPFTTLRTLPPGVFRDVDWSFYIPHL